MLLSLCLAYLVEFLFDVLSVAVFVKICRGNPHETRLTIQREPAQPLEFLDRCRHKLFS